ncbi:MAG: DUF4239 domain-containing protein [Actinobacteria bacterium]|nr:DUF4239 domain-containing protein [Actinomycetota bacterium]MBV8481151.1 DUF4239 domain-containing protein [Actinomycetota bacterium]
MDRWLLNTLPTWALALVVVGGALCVGLGGFALMRRLVPSLAAHADSRSLSSAFSISSGLFSFVLAFTIGQLYTNFTRANADAKQEATVLAQVLRTSSGLPQPLAGKIRADVLIYADDVRGREWKEMRRGQSSLQAWHDIDAMYATLDGGRKAAGSNPFYSDTLSRINDLVVARRTRLDDANIALPDVFQVLLVLGAVLALSTTFYFKPFGERIQVVMIGAASALVGTALLVALTLDYPYSGSIAVSSAPFSPHQLLLLAGSA